MQLIFGYCCAILIGVSLGLTGGGGSILTVPVLVYLFNISPVTATTYSLFIVGSTSLIGAINNIKRKCIDIQTVKSFGVSSVVTILLIRKLVIPRMPEHLFYIGAINISFSLLIMVLFSLLMIAAAFSMIVNKKNVTVKKQHTKTKLFFYGFVLGLVTGFLGAGGGFLIIPALVLFIGLAMKKAVGTSLLIIAINAMLGFLVDVSHYKINWDLLLTITAIAIVGVFIGSFFERRINGAKLKKGFGWFVLVIGVFIFIKEIFFL
jgi:uncharacterized membrane protein YfcA